MIYTLILAFLAGCLWGLHEVTAHKWEAVQAKWPRLNPWFWNPAKSWCNKYTPCGPAFGRRKWLGIPIPALFTDAKHLSASGAQLCLLFAGICAPSPAFTLRYGLLLLATFAAYTLGNILFFSKGGIMRRQ